MSVNNSSHSPFDEFVTDSPVIKRRKTSKWPIEVENAFEEAASIIPKQSIKNITICGSKHGRSRYILFYIYYKTGSIRNIGQITSHIQAITKNNKDDSNNNNNNKDNSSNNDILNLMLNGPGETEEICENFTNIFTKIVKSLPPKLLSGDFKNLETKNQMENQRKEINKLINNNNNDNVIMNTNQPPIRVNIKKFEMVYINFKLIDDSHMFSTLSPPSLLFDEINEISIDKDLLNAKYPETYKLLNKEKNGLDNLNNLKIPIIHAKSSMFLPPITKNLLNGYYNFSIKLSFNELMKEDNKYGILTIITSKKVLIQENFEILNSTISKNKKNELITNSKIGTNYWKNYLSTKRREMIYNGNDPQLIKLQEKSFELEIQPLKIQQFIIYCGENNYNDGNNINIDNLNLNDVRCILIWRFNKVDNQSQAITTFTKINSIIDKDKEKDEDKNENIMDDSMNKSNSLFSLNDRISYENIITPPTTKRSSVPIDQYSSNNQYLNNYYNGNSYYNNYYYNDRNYSMPIINFINNDHINNNINDAEIINNNNDIITNNEILPTNITLINNNYSTNHLKDVSPITKYFQIDDKLLDSEDNININNEEDSYLLGKKRYGYKM